jgi:hypothetical protein
MDGTKYQLSDYQLSDIKHPFYATTTTATYISGDENEMFLFVVAMYKKWESETLNNTDVKLITAKNSNSAKEIFVRTLSEEQFEQYQNGDLKVEVKIF